jgi:hypothetical protein
MLVNYIRVYQLSGSPSGVVGQAQGNSGSTGAGGTVAVGQPIPSRADPRLVGQMSNVTLALAVTLLGLFSVCIQ